MTAESRKRILVVEDEEAYARLLTWQLEAVGYEVRAVTRGADALRCVHDFKPELVMLDLRLPDIHGYDVCRELRKQFHPWVVPIVMLTAMDQPMDQLRGFAFGADAYLTKPCKESELIKTVTLLLGETIPR